ncbi:cytochrome c maturation protein CcmE [Biformimicrobium ophioploci]|nr:cytochrome c maturation protein CcmE [Microbulbifer sp. NKW57]
MHPVRKQRLILVLLLVTLSSAAIALITYALRQNIDFFYPPSKFAAEEVPHNVRVRAGGCVVPGSVFRSEESLAVRFSITDGVAQVPVKYTGILPDLFAEGEAAVVTGKLQSSGVFEAEQVLAKHDETYTPPEVQEAMVGDHTATCQGAGKAMASDY